MTNRMRFAHGVAAVAAAFWLVTGGWAFAAPASFAARVATFDPYNRHLVHDVGALSLGIGVTLLLALRRPAALSVALAGTATAAALHDVSHILDRGLGGRGSDPYTLAAFALLCVAGAAAALTPPRPTVVARRETEVAA